MLAKVNRRTSYSTSKTATTNVYQNADFYELYGFTKNKTNTWKTKKSNRGDKNL